MQPLALHEFHRGLNARFIAMDGMEAVGDYGDRPGEHAALRDRAGVVDLGFRGRLCLTGADRVRFLHGQVTNDVKRLRPGEGCYAALVTARGKMQSDLNIFALAEELLLDFGPGLAAMIVQRLEKYIVADDVQVVDVAPHYGLLTIQGPEAARVVRSLEIFPQLPAASLSFVQPADSGFGEIYLMQHTRIGSAGFDLFVPVESLHRLAGKLATAAGFIAGALCGWDALEIARMEAGIPRFGVDMDESNLPLECGIEQRAISYSKGCYIGQEVINRIHSIGHVNKELRGLRLADELSELPIKGDKLFQGDREVGYITSALKSPALNGVIALGYVRREANAVGTGLTLRTAAGECPATVADLPFVRPR